MKFQKMIRFTLTCLLLAAFLTGCSTGRPSRNDNDERPTKTKAASASADWILWFELAAKKIDKDILATQQAILENRIKDSDYMVESVEVDATRMTFMLSGKEAPSRHWLEQISGKGELAFIALDDANKTTGDVIVDTQHIKKASLKNNTNGIPGQSVGISLNTDGAKRFGEATEALVGKRIGVFLDNQLIFSPTVQTGIYDGELIITLTEEDDARGLVAILQSGLLPIDIIDQGLTAADGSEIEPEETVATTSPTATAGYTAENIFVIANEQSTRLVAMESADAISYRLDVTDWSVGQVEGTVNIDADSADEQIILGLDNPNGIKALIVNQGSGINLMNYIETYPEGYYTDYGDVALGTTLELSFADIDSDGIKDCILSVHTEELGTAVTVFKAFRDEVVLCPYIDIGTYQNLDAAWLDVNGILWMVSKDNGLVSSVSFQPKSMQYASEEDGTTSFVYKARIHVQNMDGNALPMSYDLKRARFAEAGELQQFIAQNRWYLVEDEYLFIQFDEDTFLIGDTGTWTTYRFVDGAVDLTEGVFSCHVIESSNDGDGDAGPGTVVEENIDFRFQFSKTDNALMLSFDNHNNEISFSYALALDTTY